MSKLKPLFRFAPPRRDSDTLLPAVLAAALLSALFLQLLLRDDVDLPDGQPVGAGLWRRGHDVVLTPVAVPAGVAQRSIFAPNGAGTSAAPADPLGGTIFAGAVRIGRVTYAVVQPPGQAVRNVPPGGVVAGWRLDAIAADGVRLSRGAEHVQTPFGAARPATAETPPSDEEAQ